MKSPFRSDLFANKNVLVTGGATGIGLGIAKAFAAHGAHVVILSRNEERLVAACDDIGHGAAYRTADVRDAERLQAIADELPVMDVLVNCAAGNFPAPFSGMSDHAFGSVIDIVLGGTVNVTRAFGERMKAGSARSDEAARGKASAGEGSAASDDAPEGPGARSIINIVAGYAWTGAPGVSHSGAAKAGVLNLTKSLAVEWAADGVRCNAVSPGPIGGTEGMKRLGEDLGLSDAVNRSVPLGRHGDVGDIADACLFLASPGADYVTGACLVVDGGQDAVGPFGSLFMGIID